jgi:two-component system, response regulator, stage 0 sporulation protein F
MACNRNEVNLRTIELKTVLIVDDDREFASELGDILTDEDFDVNIVNDSMQAANMMTNFIFDVLILDYKMPLLNGIELIKTIKNKDSKIIIISGSLDIENLVEKEGIKKFVSYIISKPFQIDDFLNKIKTL